jgi:hypothetical protein
VRSRWPSITASAMTNLQDKLVKQADKVATFMAAQVTK